MKYYILVAACLLALMTKANTMLVSPNEKIRVELKQLSTAKNVWFLNVYYNNNEQKTEEVTKVALGLSRSDQDFHTQLKFVNASKPTRITDNYTMLHGKKSNPKNQANEIKIRFENPNKTVMNLILRAYNDGVCFKYEFPEKNKSYEMKDEYSSFAVNDSSSRWLQKFDLSNEFLFSEMNNGNTQQSWGYPALFHQKGNKHWFLLHESDLDRTYCATKLSNYHEKNSYKTTFPAKHEGEGRNTVMIETPWQSPWRVMIIGELPDIVESTLVDDVARPTQMTNTEWIKPGLVSWNYWSDNHGTRNFQTVRKFADLAATMDWPYTLLDWEWDAMTNGGNVEEAAKYIVSKGVKPLIWYNSGMFKWITATPVDRMKTHENRMKEFAWLKSLGFVGVKIDFFLSEKQDMIKYYLDIVEDAAKHQMMVYFHGCLVPRGWSRTYPHIMTYEAIRGAEWYNNGPEFTTTATQHNCIIPFTRNVVGSMDYTPVTFTNSQYPHITSYGHELATGVIFESALQHMADRPEGYLNKPIEVVQFLRDLPAKWDNIKLIKGYPGQGIVMARQHNEMWYLAGLNGENKKKKDEIALDFIEANIQYKLSLIADGEHDKDFEMQYFLVEKGSKINVDYLPRGGFVARIEKIK